MFPVRKFSFILQCYVHERQVFLKWRNIRILRIPSSYWTLPLKNIYNFSSNRTLYKNKSLGEGVRGLGGGSSVKSVSLAKSPRIYPRAG